MGCSGCSGQPIWEVTSADKGTTGGPDLQATLSLASPGGDADPGTEVTTALNVGHGNAVSTTAAVIALTTGEINIAIYGSNDLETWIHLADVADVSSVGSTIGQVAGVTTSYVRALVTLSTASDPAECIVSLRLHVTSI